MSDETRIYLYRFEQLTSEDSIDDKVREMITNQRKISYTNNWIESNSVSVSDSGTDSEGYYVDFIHHSDALIFKLSL